MTAWYSVSSCRFPSESRQMLLVARRMRVIGLPLDGRLSASLVRLPMRITLLTMSVSLTDG